MSKRPITMQDQMGEARAEEARAQLKSYALAIVVEAKDADAAWEEMGQVAGGTYDEFDMAFLGDPFPIATQDEYDSGQAANAILQGVSSLRDGLPVLEKNGWLIEWDGGWATRDTEREAWIRVGELCADSQDSGYTAADFKVARNMPPEPEAGAMSTSDGLGGDAPVSDQGAGRFLMQLVEQGADFEQLGRGARKLFGPFPATH